MTQNDAHLSQGHFRTPLESATLARFGWLIGMRWFFVLGIILGAVLGQRLMPELPLLALLSCAAVMAAYNLLLQLLRHRLPGLKEEQSGPLVEILIQLQVMADWLVLLALIHYTGGVESPLLHFYIFHVALSAIFLKPRFTVLGLAFILCLMSLLFWLEASGHLPRIVLGGITVERNQLEALPIITFCLWYYSTLIIMALLLGAVMRGLRRREMEALRMRLRLEAAMAESSRIAEERVRLMHTMGHELRSPIAAVLSMLGAIKAAVTQPLPEQVKRLHQRMEIRLRELTGLISELLELAEQRSGNRQGEVRHINLCGLLAELVEQHEAQAREAGLRLTRHCDSHEEYWIPARSDELRRIFENLISNAIKYSRSGGLVQISSQRVDAELLVEVRDEGIGISAEQQARLFQDFYRTPQSRKHTSQGTGLGLAITHAMILAAGGRIEVESELEKGSTFRVILPLAGS